MRRGRLPADLLRWTSSAYDRCLLGFECRTTHHHRGATTRIIQIFQTPDYVAILNEQNHDVRVIPLGGQPHVHDRVRQWMGDSRGRWEGETLVVETRRFNGKHDQIARPLLSSGENLSLVERFTRTDAENLMYEYTVTDASIWTAPWTAQHPMKRNADLIYEFACHEGNYGMDGILAGSRAQEAAGAR